MGDESNNVHPPSSAAVTTSRASPTSSVSNVFDVPIPTTGTIGASGCFGESDRVSICTSLREMTVAFDTPRGIIST
jgi:hypothetical protein